MKILAFDTSTEYLSVAILNNGKVLARSHRKVGRNHSRLLVLTISNLVKNARLKADDMDAVAVGVGPGSFTGLRIGAGVAKGLSYSLGIPVAAVPTFDAIAGNFKKNTGVICVVLDARKNKVYGCLYRSDGKTINRISKYMLVDAEELLKTAGKYDKVLFVGDGCGILGRDCTKKRAWYPRAEVIASLGAEFLKKKKSVKPEALEPMYLYSRHCDITGR